MSDQRQRDARLLWPHITLGMLITTHQPHLEFRSSNAMSFFTDAGWLWRATQAWGGNRAKHKTPTIHALLWAPPEFPGREKHEMHRVLHYAQSSSTVHTHTWWGENTDSGTQTSMSFICLLSVRVSVLSTYPLCTLNTHFHPESWVFCSLLFLSSSLGILPQSFPSALRICHHH